MNATDILIVEDDEDIRDLIAYNMEREGFRLSAVESGEEALQLIEKETPGLILLDLMLPNMDGLEVCRRLKADAKTSGIPIIMVSAKGSERDVVIGLELGADDYIGKPFRPKELAARVRAVLRRSQEPQVESTETLVLHDIEVHPGRREVRVKGRPIQLTFTEFQVLLVLARRPGWVFTRYQIVDSVHGSDYPVTDRSVDVQIVGLRKKLGKAGRYIETVRGIGYRFRDAEQ